MQIFPAGTPQCPVPEVFMVKTFAVYLSPVFLLIQSLVRAVLNVFVGDVSYKYWAFVYGIPKKSTYGTVWVIGPIILVEALLRAVSYPLRSITMSNHVATYVNHSSPMGDGKCFDSQLVFELVPPLLQSVQQKLE